MEFLVLTLFLVVMAVVLLSIAVSRGIRGCRTPPNLPPGPGGIPVLGYIPWLSATPYRDFQELRKLYGDFYSVRLGRRWHVVLNGSRVIRKALVENGSACSGRPNWILNRILKGKAVANEQPDSHWRMHRSFWYALFRQLGHDRIDKIIKQELGSMKDALNRENGSPIDPSDFVKLTFCNIICMFCFGKRYAAEDPEFHRLQHNADTYMQNLAKASRSLPFCGQAKKVFQDISAGYKGIIKFIKERIEEHKSLRLRDRTRACDDLLDVYFNGNEAIDEVDHIGILPRMQDLNMNDSKLMNGKIASEPRSKHMNGIDEANLPNIVLDIFVGGLETINAAMMWSLLAMVKYPDVQQKIQKELRDKIGPHQIPTFQQINELPYTKAALLEVYRIGNVIPLAIPHRVTQPVVIDGYELPTGTRLLPNIYSAHMDPEEWINPEEFDPTRFLDEKGQVKIPQAFMPFSVGKRVCMGENLARKELFLAFTTVLQNFTLLPADDEKMPNFDGIPGTTRIPLPFKLRAIPLKT